MGLVYVKWWILEDHDDGGDDHKMISSAQLGKKKEKNKALWRSR
jgi:hypothetical protein